MRARAGASVKPPPEVTSRAAEIAEERGDPKAAVLIRAGVVPAGPPRSLEEPVIRRAKAALMTARRDLEAERR